jgi:hypothetical protein
MLLLSKRIGVVVYINPKDIPPEMTVAELFVGGQVARDVLAKKSYKKIRKLGSVLMPRSN